MLVLIICLVFLINILVFSVFHYYSLKLDSSSRANLEAYAVYIKDDLGLPPNKVKAAALSKKLNASVSYHSESEKWVTGQHTEDFPDDKLYPLVDSEGINVASSHGFIRFTFTEANHVLTVRILPNTSDLHELRILLLLLLGFVVIILFSAFLVIRKLLSPIKMMYSAMEIVRAGDFQHRIQHKGKDELGQLCTTFNDLSETIEQAIYSREHLIADISHELRTPLTSMRIAADMVDDKELKASLIDDISHMDKLINTVLEYSRFGFSNLTIKKNQFNFTKIAKKCVSPFNKDVELIELVIDDEIIFYGSSLLIESLITNLLSNAVKYSSNSEKHVLMMAEAKDGILNITIRDHGAGISGEDIPYIFEPFYRSDSARTRNTGFGLGLSICKKIVDIHNGEISVSSTEGAGTEIKIYFKLN
jgi:signal transduction histidine kinase